MAFLSLEFFLFAFGLWVFYRKSNLRWQNLILAVGNLTFICSWGLKPLLIHSAIVVVGYFAGRFHSHWENLGRGRLYFFAVGTALLLPLSFLKMAQAWGLHWIWPVGLSYYTFQVMSYLIDLKRKKFLAEQDFLHFFLFSSFFPSFLMGPIERMDSLGQQFKKRREFPSFLLLEGFFLVSLGIFKKTVVADRLYSVFSAYSNFPEYYNRRESWLVLVLVFFQSYCDFSGYVDIARGLGKFFGIHLRDNFFQPYFSRNIPDVWNRWHISLVQWVREYFYWPVFLKTKNIYLATFLTLLLIGLWHNLSFNYLLWTVFWSLLYFLHIWIRSRSQYRKWSKSDALTTLGRFGVLLCLLLSGAVLMANSPQKLLSVLSPLIMTNPLVSGHALLSTISASQLLISLIGILLMIFMESMYFKFRDQFASKTDLLIKFSVLAAVLLFLSLVFGISNSHYFLYMGY